jgi:hypothetical protein
LIYCTENPLLIIAISSISWGWVKVIGLVIDFGELVKVVLKREVGKRVGEWRKRKKGCWVLCPSSFFGIFLLS